MIEINKMDIEEDFSKVVTKSPGGANDQKNQNKSLKISYLYYYRAVVVAGAEGATAPVNFEQRVHAPVN